MSNFNPFFYWNSPLPIELLQFLKKQYENLKNDYDSLKAVIENINNNIENISNTIEQTVIDTLNTMYADGRLKAILEEITLPELEEIKKDLDNSISLIRDNAQNISSINMSRKWRTIYSTGRNYKPDEDGTAKYSSMQGGCTYERTGVKYFAYVNIALNSPFNNSDYGVLHIAEYETGNEIKQSKPFYCGHANSMCYYNGYLYLVMLSTGGGDTLNNTIIKINVDTLEMEYKDIKGVSSYLGIDTDGQNLYLYSHINNNVYILDYDTATITKYAKIPKELNQGVLQYVSQDFSINKDNIYILTVTQAMLIKIDRQNMNRYWIYDFNRVMDNMYFVGEIENITAYDNGIIDFGTVSRLQNVRYNSHMLAQLFTVNLNSNYYIRDFTLLGEPDQTEIIVVDSSVMGITGNPDGTTERPYYCLQEALNHAMASPVGAVEINLKTGDTFFNTVNTNKPIFISPDSSKFNKNNLCQCGGMYLRGAHIKFNLLNIGCSNTGGAPNYYIKACVQSSYSLVNFADCNFDYTANNKNFRPTNYTILSNGSFVAGRGEQSVDLAFNSSGGFMQIHA